MGPYGLASHDRGPAWVRYYFRDHLGTPRVIARPDGSKCYDADYYPFGGERVYLNNCPDNYKFTGYERDAESDLDYAVHRYYSYRIGRFQTPEPCALTSSACSGATVSLRLFNPAQQSPAETNLYTYVVNNPLNRTDPEGLWWGCPWWDPWCGRGECHGYGRACWPGGGWPRRGVVIIIFFRESKRARCLRSAWNVFKECWTGEAGLVCGEALLTAYVICRFAGWTLPCHLAVGAAVAVCIYEGGVCGLEAVREYNRCMAH